MNIKYHSALGEAESFTPVNRCTDIVTGSVAICHDIFNDLPPEYEKAQVIYTELPWVNGFDVFEGRVRNLNHSFPGKYEVGADRSYKRFLARVSEIINSIRIPVVIVAGKKTGRGLPEPLMTHATKLNNDPAIAYCYRIALHRTESDEAILEELVNRYDVVGDFCCGYGRAAKAFSDAGKKFVVSDYNPMCIGYMASWMTNAGACNG